MRHSIALIGNPNVGKTSLFNRLTFSSEHVGNWHGVTTDKKTKGVSFEGDEYLVSDLPGLYSLTVYSSEERISANAVISGEYDLYINVCDIGNLAKNLYLTLQLRELGVPMILAVNMMDELTKRGKTLDTELLQKRLGIEVVTLSAKYKHDAKKLLRAAAQFFEEKRATNKSIQHLSTLPIKRVEQIILSSGFCTYDNEWAAIKVLEEDADIIKSLRLGSGQLEKLMQLGDTQGEIARHRYKYIDYICEGILCGKANSAKSSYLHGQSRIDKAVLNKYLALPIFFLVMAFVFFVTFGVVGRFLSTCLEQAINKAVYTPLQGLFDSMGCPQVIKMLVLEGVVLGVGGVLTFLPQVVLLFLFLALLEDSGYFSRVAFMSDGFFSKIGLSGKSSFTMMMGFGCSATAVLCSRGIASESVRKKTIMLTPFFSCSARLPVYTVIASAFFLGSEPLIIFIMYALGVAVAICVAALTAKNGCSQSDSFIMEMPPYRLPTLERVWQLIAKNVTTFLVRVGTVVFSLSIIVWVLSNFSPLYGFIQNGEHKSIFELIASVFAPLFSPLGFGEWRAVTALLGGIIAKEIVISSIESLGGVTQVFSSQYAAISAMSFMIFTLLYVPCVATLAAIKKETSTKFMLACLLVQLFAAYMASLIFYWLARLYLYNSGAFIGAIVMVIVVLGMTLSYKRGIKCVGCKNSCKKNTKRE